MTPRITGSQSRDLGRSISGNSLPGRSISGNSLPSLPRRPDEQVEAGITCLPVPARPDDEVESSLLGSGSPTHEDNSLIYQGISFSARGLPGVSSSPKGLPVPSAVPPVNIALDDQPMWEDPPPLHFWNNGDEALAPPAEPRAVSDIEAPPPPEYLSADDLEPEESKTSHCCRSCACRGFCCVFALGCITGLVILFCSIHRLGPEEQVVTNDGEGKFVRNGPGTVLLSPFRKKEFRSVSHLEHREYAVLKNAWTRALHHYPGPGLLWLGAYDVVERIEQKIVLQQQDYIRLFDNATALERVVAGPLILVPGPYEVAAKGIEKSITLGPDTSAVIENRITGVLRLVSKSGMLTPGAYEVIQEVRKALLLGPRDYASVRSLLTGELRHEAGPQLLKLGPYDQLEKISQKVILRKDEYIKFQNQKTGSERVLRGPRTLVPEPYEISERGSQRVAFLDTDTAALVLNRGTGQQRLVAKKVAFTPGPYEEIIDTRSLIRLLPYEAVVVKDAEGMLRVHRGSQNQKAFFLPPFSEVVEMKWSSFNHMRQHDVRPDLNDTTSNKSAPLDSRSRSDSRASDTSDFQAGVVSNQKIDLRVRRTFFTYDARTSDNVELLISGTIFWRVSNVEQLVRTTSDPEGDVWHHTRSAVIQALSRATLMSFMSTMSDLTMQAFEEQEADSFYAERGVELHSIEITGYECADNGTALVLQQIIQGTTNRINQLQVQETADDVQALKLAGQTMLEKKRTQLIQNRGENARLEAAADGDAEGLKRLGAAATFIGGLSSSVPSVEQRLDLYELHLRLKSRNVDTQQLASSNAQLFLTPAEVGITL